MIVNLWGIWHVVHVGKLERLEFLVMFTALEACKFFWMAITACLRDISIINRTVRFSDILNTSMSFLYCCLLWVTAMADITCNSFMCMKGFWPLFIICCCKLSYPVRMAVREQPTFLSRCIILIWLKRFCSSKMESRFYDNLYMNSQKQLHSGFNNINRLIWSL